MAILGNPLEVRIPCIFGLCYFSGLNFREYPQNSYGTGPYLHSIGSWRSPIDTMDPEGHFVGSAYVNSARLGICCESFRVKYLWLVVQCAHLEKWWFVSSSMGRITSLFDKMEHVPFMFETTFPYLWWIFPWFSHGQFETTKQFTILGCWVPVTSDKFTETPFQILLSSRQCVCHFSILVPNSQLPQPKCHRWDTCDRHRSYHECRYHVVWSLP